LALAHEQDGASVQLLGRLDGEWQQWTKRNQIEALLDWPLEGSRFDLILLAVADKDLQSVIEQVAKSEIATDAVVVHLSGASDVTILQPLQAATAIAALHPLMAFSESARDDLQQLATSAVIVDCADDQLDRIHAMVDCWQARFRRLPADQNRASYHLGLALLSNHITSITAWAKDLLQPALGEETETLIRAMSQRAVEATLMHGGQEALTGPVVRGDLTTIQEHLASLPADQAERSRGSLIAVIDLAAASGRLPAEHEAQLRTLTKGSQNR
jgi:predicted short-subunit dehydrogenase-like oxidoreductase (DUF2520 family)